MAIKLGCHSHHERREDADSFQLIPRNLASQETIWTFSSASTASKRRLGMPASSRWALMAEALRFNQLTKMATVEAIWLSKHFPMEMFS